MARRATQQPGFPVIKFVRVDPDSRRYEKTILAEMAPLVGKPLDLDAVGARITDLYGLGYFETLDYTVVAQGQGPDQEYGLEVRARRKSWGPNYVRFGLALESNFQGSNQYNVAAEFLQTEIDDLAAELQTNVQIGSDTKITSEFYQPLDALAKWFVAPSVRLESRDLPIYQNNSRIADFRDREVEGDLDVGRNLGNWGEIRVGIHRINGLTYDYFGNPDLVDPQYNNGEYFFKFSYDQLDNVHFPREGQSFTVQWDANRTNLGADTDFDRVSVDWLAAASRGRNTLLLWTSAGATLDGRLQAQRCAGFLLSRRLSQSFRTRAAILARSELRDRPRHLFSQDQPRRRGLLRVSGVYRRIARARQHLGAAQRYQLRLGAQGRLGVHRHRYAARARLPGLGL